MSRFGLEVSQDKLRDDEGYVDLVREIDTPSGVRPAYISVSMIRQWASRIPQVGLVPINVFEGMRRERDELRVQLAQLRAEHDQAQAAIASYRDGFEQVMGKGKTPPKRQGRPPVNRKVAA